MADYLPISDYPESYKQLRVNPNKPQDQLRRLDLIALEHFDGYIAIALHQIYLIGNDKELADSLAADLTSTESHLLLEMAQQSAEQKGGKDVFSKMYKMASAQERTGMTEDAIRAAEKNPFVKPLWISAGLLVGVLALFIVGAAILAKVAPGETTANIASFVVYAGMLLLLTDLVKKAQQVIAFRTVKKMLPWYDEYNRKAAEPDATPIIPELPVKLSPIEERALSKRNAIFVTLFTLFCIGAVVGSFALPITGNLAWAWLVGGSLLLIGILALVIVRKGDAITAYLARRIEEKQALKNKK